MTPPQDWLAPDEIHCGDAPTLLKQVAPDSIACSVWSPPYHVGKNYEQGVTFDQWQAMLRDTIQGHERVLKPGGFVVVNIADILCFSDEAIPASRPPT